MRRWALFSPRRNSGDLPANVVRLRLPADCGGRARRTEVCEVLPFVPRRGSGAVLASGAGS